MNILWEYKVRNVGGCEWRGAAGHRHSVAGNPSSSGPREWYGLRQSGLSGHTSV